MLDFLSSKLRYSFQQRHLMMVDCCQILRQPDKTRRGPCLGSRGTWDQILLLWRGTTMKFPLAVICEGVAAVAPRALTLLQIRIWWKAGYHLTRVCRHGNGCSQRTWSRPKVKRFTFITITRRSASWGLGHPGDLHPPCDPVFRCMSADLFTEHVISMQIHSIVI